MVQLIELLKSGKVVDVINFFLENNLEYSQVQIIKKVKLAKATAVKWLGLMVKSKVLHVRKIGPTNLYTLNKEHKLVKVIQQLK